MLTKTTLFSIAASVLVSLVSHAEESPIATQMDLFNDAYKAMRKEQDGAKGAELARQSQDSILKALVEVPEMVKAMPDGPDKTKAIAEYRKMMAELVALLGGMELAFLNGEMDKIPTFIEQLKESKKVGHDKFIEE